MKMTFNRKIITKISALCCAVMVIFSAMPANAYAVEAIPEPSCDVNKLVHSEIEVMPCASTAPTESHSLPYTATVTDLCEGCGTYTKYYFKTTTGKITISGTLKSCGDKNNTSRYARIDLYEVNNSTSVDSYTVDQFLGSTTLNHTFNNLSAGKNYYIRIVNTTSWGVLADYWIEGSVDIDD